MPVFSDFHCRALCIAAVLWLCAGVALAGSKPVELVRTSGDGIALDGRTTETVWQQALVIDSWYRQTPDEGSAPSQATRMLLFYDDEAIYLAARMDETDMSRLVARSLERDSFDNQQDAICILLDTYNDDRTAYGFIVTPAGVRTDIAVALDGEGHYRAWNKEWNTFWDAAVHQDDSGWTAELRIPFSSLRFEGHDEGVEMGLILWRYLARNAEFDIYPRIPNKWQNSAFKPSQALDVRFRGVAARNPMYIKPYGLGGLNQVSDLRADGTAYDLRKDWQREAGLDLKYNLTSNLILDVTLNTDFAQVEVDDQRINTTRFSLFFPEKRDFFQERAELFTYRFPGGPQRLFQSRRIGIVKGQTVPILGGVRLTGRTGSWELGLIEMQADKSLVDEATLPSENFGVLRLRREFLEPGSFIGGMFTSRTDFRGTYNLVAAADADFRFVEQYYAKIHYSQSFENGSNPADSWYSSITVQRRIRKGFSLGVSGSHYGPAFNPGLGFLTRNNVDRFGSRVQYTWFPGARNLLQSHTLTNRMSFVWTALRTHPLETFDDRLTWSGRTKSGARLEVGMRFRREAILNTFSVGEIEIVPARYDFFSGQIKLESAAGGAFQYKLEGLAGSYFGGRQIQTVFSPSWTFSQHLALAMDYEYNRIAAHEQLFNAHLLRLRLRSAVNHALSINAFVQFRSDDANLSTNVRLRYNPVEGTDLYLVYTESVNTELDPADRFSPRLPRTDSRAILLKYSTTFIR